MDQAQGFFLHAVLLDFNGKVQILAAKVAQELFQRGDSFALKALARGQAEVDLQQLRVGQVVNGLGTARDAHQFVVMKQHQHAILGALHVSFDAVRAHLPAHIKGGKGVFGGIGAGAAVRVVDKFHNKIHPY